MSLSPDPSFLSFLRRYIPTIVAGMDFAPVIIIFALIFLETFLTHYHF
jgi:YggT family protein